MQIVAIKQLDRNGTQGIREFVVEVLTLSNAEHTNLVKLMGYCAEGDQRLLVYEFMPLGSLEDHLHGKSHKFNVIVGSSSVLILSLIIGCQDLDNSIRSANLTHLFLNLYRQSIQQKEP